MSPKRILVVGHTAQLGGNELFMTRLVPALADDDLEMVVLLFEDGPFADLLRERGVEVHVRPLPSDVVSAGRYAAGKVTTLGRLGPGVIRHAVGLAPWLAEQRIDAVWANTFKAMATVSPAVKVRRLPLLWFLHDRVTPDYLPRRLVGPMRAAFRQVPDAVVANSRSTAATVGGRPVTVVYPGLSADAERLRVEPPQGDVEVVAVARRDEPLGYARLAQGGDERLRPRHPPHRVHRLGALRALPQLVGHPARVRIRPHLGEDVGRRVFHAAPDGPLVVVGGQCAPEFGGQPHLDRPPDGFRVEQGAVEVPEDGGGQTAGHRATGEIGSSCRPVGPIWISVPSCGQTPQS